MGKMYWLWMGFWALGWVILIYMYFKLKKDNA